MGILDGIIDAIGGGITGGGLLGLGGSFISGLMSSDAQENTNNMNRDLSQQNSAFNAAEADKNRTFQAEQAQENRMFELRARNSAMTDRVADLKRAGLNPMLAYGQGAAQPSGSTPSGATASAAPMPAMQNVTAAGLNSAAQSAQIRQSLQASDLTEASVEKTRAETIQSIGSAGHLDAMKDNIRQEMQSFEKRMEKLGHETFYWKYKRELPSYDLAEKERAVQRDWPGQEQMIQHAKYLASQARLLGLKVPEAVAEAAWWGDPERGAVGTQFRHGAPALDKLFTGSMTKGAEMLRDSGRTNSAARGFQLNQQRPATGYYGR